MLKFLKKARLPNWSKFFYGRDDLLSMNEMVQAHAQMINSRQQKYIRTNDTQTLDIAQKLLKDNQFLKQNLLSCPGTNVNEVQSLKVKICNIQKHPLIYQQYKQWKTKGKGRIIAMGGPSASDQTLISCLIDSIKSTHDVHFYCRSYLQTNALHSANQSHARDVPALNNSPSFSGRHLLPIIIKRFFIPTDYNDLLNSDYLKIDLKLNSVQNFIQCSKNQYNGIKQIFKAFIGQKTQHDMNRLQALVSQQIQKIMEKQSGMALTTNYNQDMKNSMALKIMFKKQSLKKLQQEIKQYKKIKQLKWEEVSIEQFKQMFPQSVSIVGGLRFYGDFANKFDMYELEKQKCKELGAVWKQNKTLKKVFLNKDNDGNPYTCGVLFEDGEFVPADKVHLSLGYKAYYQFQQTQKNALNNIIFGATGVSSLFIMKNTPSLKKILQTRGSLEMSMVNSHWTTIVHNDDYVLIRSTAGGNTGAQTYRPEYFINLCYNTRRIFGDAFIGVVSAYGCVRTVNYKNSTQIARIADGLVVSYGKAGAGVTKRASQAYSALKYLGLQDDIENYFKKFKPQRVSVVDSFKQIFKQAAKNNVFYDNSKKTINNLFK